MFKAVLLLILLALVNAEVNEHFMHPQKKTVSIKLDALKKPPTEVKTKAPVKKPLTTRAPVKKPSTRAPTKAPSKKVAYREVYADSSCGSTMPNTHPIHISGIVLDTCQRSDAEGTKSEMWFMKSGTELGSNSYNGPDCKKSNFIKYEPFPFPLTNGEIGCTPMDDDGSFKGFIAESSSAMIQKYSSMNTIITFNYPTGSCKGEFPSLDITVVEPCQESTDHNGNPDGTYVTNIFTATGVDQSVFSNPSCTGTPQRASYTYAQMEFSMCRPSDDPSDSLKYELMTTNFLLQPTQSPTRAPTYKPRAPTPRPTRTPTEQVFKYVTTEYYSGPDCTGDVLGVDSEATGICNFDFDYETNTKRGGSYKRLAIGNHEYYETFTDDSCTKGAHRSHGPPFNECLNNDDPNPDNMVKSFKVSVSLLLFSFTITYTTTLLTFF